ncbi:MAG TPA: hypothetical protein VIH59_17065 [Candidatus Tectomicrobia bacterium]
MTDTEAGAPGGQKTLPPAGFAQRKARLAPPLRFASYLEIPQGRREEYGREGPYKTLHGIVRYQLKAQLKRLRPRQVPPAEAADFVQQCERRLGTMAT